MDFFPSERRTEPTIIFPFQTMTSLASHFVTLNLARKGRGRNCCANNKSIRPASILCTILFVDRANAWAAWNGSIIQFLTARDFKSEYTQSKKAVRDLKSLSLLLGSLINEVISNTKFDCLSGQCFTRLSCKALWLFSLLVLMWNVSSIWQVPPSLELVIPRIFQNCRGILNRKYHGAN